MLHETASGANPKTATTGTGNCIPYGRAVIPGAYSVLQLESSFPINHVTGKHLRFSVLAKTGVAVVPSIEIDGNMGKRLQPRLHAHFALLIMIITFFRCLARSYDLCHGIFLDRCAWPSIL